MMILHAFNQIMCCDQEELNKVLVDFVVDKNKQKGPIKLSEVRDWLASAPK